MKIELKDNYVKIQNISIICMFKNNATYIKQFFTDITTIFENMYDVEFTYYIIENNSKDDTREILKDFISKKSKKSKLILFDVDEDFKNIGEGKNYERLDGIGNIRNKLVNSITPLNSEWSLFIDSNIYFKPNILERMFAYNPSANNIGMMTPYTQQLFIPEIHKSLNLKQPTFMHHFYDTFAFYDTSNKSSWPFCAFEKCTLCHRKWNDKQIDRKVVGRHQEVVDVHSTFGGFSAIKTGIINDKRVRWSTLSYDTKINESICEHFIFCHNLRLLSDKRIVMLQNIDDIYRSF